MAESRSTSDLKPESLSEIIYELEAKIKDYEMNMVPKYSDEVHMTEDRVVKADRERDHLVKGLKDELDIEKKKILEIVEQSKREKEGLLLKIDDLNKRTVAFDEVIKDNQLLAVELDKYSTCLDKARVIHDNQKLRELTLEQETETLKIHLKQKNKDCENLKNQIVTLLEASERLKLYMRKLESLANAVNMELKESNFHSWTEMSLGSNFNDDAIQFDSSLKIFESLLASYCELKAEVSKFRESTYTSPAPDEFHSGNFPQLSINGMRKVPSVPILTGKRIAQIREARARQANSLHASVGIPDKFTGDTNDSHREISEKIQATKLENRRLSAALIITNKQFNAANLEKRELVQELSQAQSNYADLMALKLAKDSSLSQQLASQSIRLQQACTEASSLHHANASLQAASQAMRGMLSQLQSDNMQLACRISDVEGDCRRERDRCGRLERENERLSAKLAQIERGGCGKGAEGIAGNGGSQKDDGQGVSESEAESADTSEQAIGVSLKQFKLDILKSLKIREQMKNEEGVIKALNLIDRPQAIVDTKSLSRSELLCELKTRLEFIQKVNTN